MVKFKEIAEEYEGTTFQADPESAFYDGLRAGFEEAMKLIQTQKMDIYKEVMSANWDLSCKTDNPFVFSDGVSTGAMEVLNRIEKLQKEG